VDSLLLQADVTSPLSVTARDVLASIRLAPAFRKATYRVTQLAGAQYELASGDTRFRADAGQPATLPQGTIVLRSDTLLPSSFVLLLLDRDDAIAAAQRRLSVSKTTGSEVLTVSFQAPDSITAAAFPNTLISEYLARRRTVDRGTNAYRAAFLGAQIDTIGRALALAEDSLRRFQEATGVLQPELQGKLQLDQAAELRTQIGAVDVERGALEQLSSQITAGQMTARQLAVYPAFLKSAGINELLGQLVKVETDRTELLGKRLETDRDVIALGQSAANIEAQIKALAASYKTSLDKQRADLTAQLDTIRHSLGTFPGAVESSGRLQRHAKQLGQTYAALQAQLVEARLAAIGEGGDVRVLDVATAPKKVVFPKKLMTMGIGAGLFVGLLLALFAGTLGRYVEDPQAIERTTGVPALRLDTSVPLLVSGSALSRTLLLVPIDGRVSTAGVAERLARVALARGSQPTVLDLSTSVPAHSSTTALSTDVSTTMARVESKQGMVIVRLPALAADETAAALRPDRTVVFVAPPGRLERRILVDAIQTLRRLEVPCAGVVVNRATDGARV
jgi:tyrosine-protein kinase Etk/Wzc